MNQPLYKIVFIALSILSTSFFSGCSNDNHKNTLRFGIAAEYPPFEYQENGKLKGFDIELAQLIAKELGKKAVFENMPFSSVLPTLAVGQIDAAIATLTITAEREKHFDFSQPYHVQSMATVYKPEKAITHLSQLTNKTIGCQLGSSMELWLKTNMPSAKIVALETNDEIISALLEETVQVVLMDGVQGVSYSEKNPALAYSIVAQSEDGYGIALKQGSPLKENIDQALNLLKAKGEIKRLEEKWLGDELNRHPMN